MTIKKSLGLFIAMLALQSPTNAQLADRVPVAIKNAETGLYLDIRRRVIRPGTPLWQWEENESDAQYFYPKATDIERAYQLLARNKHEGETQLVTILKAPPTIAQPGQPPAEQFSITLENEIPIPDTSDALGPFEVSARPKPKFQWWYFDPVVGYDNRYIVRSGRFVDNRVLTAAGDGENGSRVLLREYVGSTNQHWIVEILNVDNPYNLSLTDFKYRAGGRLEGTISWSVDTYRLDYVQVTGYSLDFEDKEGLSYQKSGEFIPTTTSWNIDFEPGRGARDREWCFYVEAVDERVGRDEKGRSPTVCEVAKLMRPNDSISTVSAVEVYNCDPQSRSARIWIKPIDASSWDDKGVLQHQGGSGGCPSTGSPKKLTLSEGQTYFIVAIESGCGSSNPDALNSTCRLLQTAAGPGSPDGPVYAVTIGGDTF